MGVASGLTSRFPFRILSVSNCLLTSEKMSAQSKGGQLVTTCIDGDFPGVRRSVSSGASVDFRGDYGRTPAMYCCIQGHPDILLYLLEQGANADLANNYEDTPLQYSAGNNKQECVIVLLAHGVAVDVIDRGGHTALWRASCNGYLPIV
jgi:ankyrin repeat protein